MSDILITAITGVITGAFGSLLAPWANWGVEKIRLRQERRVKLIAEARNILLAPPQRDEFRNTPMYSQLRPHLSEPLCSQIASNEVIIIEDKNHQTISVSSEYAPNLLAEIAKLEEKWKLI